LAGKGDEGGIGRDLFAKKEDNDEDGEGEDKKKSKNVEGYVYNARCGLF